MIQYHLTALINITGEMMHGGITWASEQVREEL